MNGEVDFRQRLYEVLFTILDLENSGAIIIFENSFLKTVFKETKLRGLKMIYKRLKLQCKG